MGKPHTYVALLFAVLAVVLAVMTASKTTAAIPTPRPQAGAGYIGSEACIACHPDQGKHFQGTVMGKAFARPKNEKEKLGCEACHGPGQAHIEAGGGKDTIPVRFTKDSKNSVEEKNGACLSCHERGNRLFWEGSPHETRKVACVDCHTGHEPVTRKVSADARFNQPL